MRRCAAYVLAALAAITFAVLGAASVSAAEAASAPIPTCTPDGILPAGAPSCLPGADDESSGQPSGLPSGPGGLPTGLPSGGLPTCLPSGVIPSQVPLPSCVPALPGGGLPIPSGTLPICLPLPTGVIPSQVPLPICPPTTISPTTEPTTTTQNLPGAPPPTTSGQVATVPAGGVETGDTGGPSPLGALAALAGVGAGAGLILWRQRRLGRG